MRSRKPIEEEDDTTLRALFDATAPTAPDLDMRLDRMLARATDIPALERARAPWWRRLFRPVTLVPAATVAGLAVFFAVGPFDPTVDERVLVARAGDEMLEASTGDPRTGNGNGGMAGSVPSRLDPPGSGDARPSQTGDAEELGDPLAGVAGLEDGDDDGLEVEPAHASATAAEARVWLQVYEAMLADN